MNVYSVKNLDFEFLKDYNREIVDYNTNMFYNFYPLNYENIYPSVDFNKKDPMGYIRFKNGTWLGNENGNGPQVVLFEYMKQNMFVVYKQIKFGSPDVLYLRYINGNLHWVDNMNYASMFIFPTDKWGDYSWFGVDKNNIGFM